MTSFFEALQFQNRSIQLTGLEPLLQHGPDLLLVLVEERGVNQPDPGLQGDLHSPLDLPGLGQPGPEANLGHGNRLESHSGARGLVRTTHILALGEMQETDELNSLAGKFENRSYLSSADHS